MQPKIKFLVLSSVLYIILVLILFVGPKTFAQVDLEINDNMLVETTGGLVVEVSGNVIENGTGYLSGTVTSGDRASVTQFAGLTLSSTLQGNITRVTGTQFSGTGTNFTRYYEINNQAGSNLTANVTTTTTAAEHGSLTGPFFHYTKNGSSWKGYGFGSTGTSVASSGDVFNQNSVTDLVISEGVGVKAKIFLEGPYNLSAHNVMYTNINSIIPSTSPYSADARTASNKPATAVDWVLVELRDNTTPGTVVASRSAYLNSDGNLIDDNATSGRGIGIAAPPGNYYVAIKHRNHLGVMTATAQTGLTWGTALTVSSYNFTSGTGSQFYPGNGSGAKLLESIPSNIWGMVAGDIDQDKEITTTDYTNWYNDAIVGNSGYKDSDCDLDGEVTTSDYTLWFNSAFVGSSSQVP